MNAEHLTKKQLVEYAEDILEQNESQKIGKHLLQCELCRKLLPTPSIEQFWKAIETESEDLQDQTPKKPFLSDFLSSVFSTMVFRPSNTFALSVGSLLVLVSFSVLLLYGLMNNSNPAKDEIAQLTEIEKTDNKKQSSEEVTVTNIKEISKTNIQQEDLQVLSQPENPIIERKNPPKKKESVKVNKKSSKDKNESEIELARLMDKAPQAVSSLRSDSKMVLRGENKSVDSKSIFRLSYPVGITVVEESPEFRWENVEGAKSYKISIFDTQFNEILTTEVTENRYQIEKTLKSGEKYLWRVVTNTADGEVIAPKPPQPPVIFRVAEKKTAKKIESYKKKKADPFKLAIFYVEEGMLDSAHCILEEILVKNPQHKAARKLLKKVIIWQKENQADVHRCGPTAPTETKPAQ